MRQPPASVRSPGPGVYDVSEPTVLADIELVTITPMFGGGATPGASDIDLRIRPSAVRGHLRFWWRACNARSYDSLEEMKKAESFLWGSAAKKGNPSSGPGAIMLQVVTKDLGSPQSPSTLPQLPVFPFREVKNPPTKEKDGLQEITFTVVLRLAPHVSPKCEQVCIDAAQEALWAWIHFGGVGARTRRGCGALTCKRGGVRTSIDTGDFERGFLDPNQIVAQAKRFVKRGDGLLQVPSLHGAKLVVGKRETRVNLAWSRATGALHDFRQAEDVGRMEGTRYNTDRRGNQHRVPGQSYWPEISAIRGHLGIPRGSHNYNIYDGDKGESFPRADLGLPIVFSQVDHNPTLEANHPNGKRMASPIILKPLKFAENDFAPMALLLHAPHPQGLKLTSNRKPIELMATPFSRWPFRSKTPPVGSTNYARDAFIEYIASEDMLNVKVVEL